MRMGISNVNELRIWKRASVNLHSKRGAVFATRVVTDLKFSLIL